GCRHRRRHGISPQQPEAVRAIWFGSERIEATWDIAVKSVASVDLEGAHIAGARALINAGIHRRLVDDDAPAADSRRVHLLDLGARFVRLLHRGPDDRGRGIAAVPGDRKHT